MERADHCFPKATGSPAECLPEKAPLGNAAVCCSAGGRSRPKPEMTAAGRLPVKAGRARERQLSDFVNIGTNTGRKIIAVGRWACAIGRQRGRFCRRDG